MPIFGSVGVQDCLVRRSQMTEIPNANLVRTAAYVQLLAVAIFGESANI